MNKKWCDTICILLLAAGIAALALCKGHFSIGDQLVTVIVCGITIILMLAVKLISYKTGYSAAERKEDSLSFKALLLLLIVLLVAGITVAN